MPKKISKADLITALRKTNKLLDEIHRGGSSSAKDCSVCDHVRDTRALLRASAV